MSLLACPVNQFGPYYLDEIRARGRLEVLERAKELLLAELDGSVSRARATYGRLRNLRVPLIARFPDDILAEIFEVVHGMSPKANPPVEMILSQVSSRWRSLVANISSLWTYIEVSGRRPTGSAPAYIERSRRRPLVLKFVLDDVLPWTRLHRMWFLLACQSQRWRRLSIITRDDLSCTLYPILHNLRYLCLPKLEDLEIKFDGPDTVPTLVIPAFQSVFRCGCHLELTNLRLEGFGLNSFAPPLNGLTTLFLHQLIPQTQYRYDEFRQLLMGLPSLSYLSIFDEVLVDVDGIPDGSTITLPNLRALRIRGAYDFVSLPYLLLALVAPSLQQLQLVYVFDYDLEDFIDQVQSTPIDRDGSSRETDDVNCPGQKFPSLTSLCIEGCHISKDTLRGLAEVFPSVKHLTCVNQLEPVLELFQETDCWKDLASLSLWSHTNSGMHLFKIRDMVKSRIMRKVPIPILRLANKPPTFPNFLLREHLKLEYMDTPARWPAWTGVFEEV